MKEIENIFKHELELMISRGFKPGISKVSITENCIKTVSEFYGFKREDVIKTFNKMFKNSGS